MNERLNNAWQEQQRIAKDLSEARATAEAATQRLVTTDFEAKGKLDNDAKLAELRANSEELNAKTEQMLEKHATDMETHKDRIASNETRMDGAQERQEKALQEAEELKAKLAEAQAEFDRLNSSP